MFISQMPGKRLTRSDKDLSEKSSPIEERYSPYRFDWRFLPEEFLLAKDYIRPYFLKANDVAANSPYLRHFWRRTLGRRTLQTIASANVLFIHIPKTGGTSISKCIYGRNLPHYSASFYANALPKSLRDVKSFAVIRHPVERMLSAYRFILLGGTELMATNRYGRYLARKSSSFEKFVDFLCEDERRLLLFETLQRQSSYVLGDDNRVIVDHLFSLDEARGLPRGLNHFLGIDIVPHINATVKIEIAVAPDVIKKICRLYSEDLELYDKIVESGGMLYSKGLSVCARHSGREPNFTGE